MHTFDPKNKDPYVEGSEKTTQCIKNLHVS